MIRTNDVCLYEQENCIICISIFMKRHISGSSELRQEISLKKIFGGSQILTILTQLNDEIPLYPLYLHAGKVCSI